MKLWRVVIKGMGLFVSAQMLQLYALMWELERNFAIWKVLVFVLWMGHVPMVALNAVLLSCHFWYFCARVIESNVRLCMDYFNILFNHDRFDCSKKNLVLLAWFLPSPYLEVLCVDYLQFLYELLVSEIWQIENNAIDMKLWVRDRDKVTINPFGVEIEEK